jgi:Fe-S oxidoreductase
MRIINGNNLEVTPSEDAYLNEVRSSHIILDDELWDRIIELTGGAAALCYQCGVCTASCPWGEVKKEPLSVRTFIRRAQLGIADGNESLWLCTACAQCEAYCPRGVNISDVFRGLRTIAWERRSVERGLPSMLWSLYWNGNPWSQPPSQRSLWAKNLGIPIFNPQRHEILLYIGCTSSYDRRAQKIAHSLASLLLAAGVKFGILGDEEPCCGEAVLSVGNKPYFKEVARETLQVFSDKGVHKLVTISPHCFDVFQNHYPRVVGEDVILPFHYTQYLAQLVEEGRLNFSAIVRPDEKTNPSNEPIIDDTGERKVIKITYQDPCFLGRRNSEYEAPRRLLEALPGVEIVEMEHSKVDGLCCGGGGGRMWLETLPGERFSDIRVVEASQTGASILATACPFCLVCLEDSAKGARMKDMQVLDVAEIAAMAL